MIWRMEKVSLSHSDTLRHIANDILAPIYGPQEKAFNEWFDLKSNKRAFVSINENSTVCGLLSMKIEDKKSYLKIATLLVLDGYEGFGCATFMLKFAIDYALSLGYEELKVTVSETKPKSIEFFKKHDFKLIETQVGKYTPGISEYIFMRRMS